MESQKEMGVPKDSKEGGVGGAEGAELPESEGGGGHVALVGDGGSGGGEAEEREEAAEDEAKEVGGGKESAGGDGAGFQLGRTGVPEGGDLEGVVDADEMMSLEETTGGEEAIGEVAVGMSEAELEVSAVETEGERERKMLPDGGEGVLSSQMENRGYLLGRRQILPPGISGPPVDIHFEKFKNWLGVIDVASELLWMPTAAELDTTSSRFLECSLLRASAIIASDSGQEIQTGLRLLEVQRKFRTALGFYVRPESEILGLRLREYSRHLLAGAWQEILEIRRERGYREPELSGYIDLPLPGAVCFPISSRCAWMHQLVPDYSAPNAELPPYSSWESAKRRGLILQELLHRIPAEWGRFANIPDCLPPSPLIIGEWGRRVDFYPRIAFVKGLHQVRIAIFFAKVFIRAEKLFETRVVISEVFRRGRSGAHAQACLGDPAPVRL